MRRRFPLYWHISKIRPTSLTFTRRIILSTFSHSLCYCIPKECCNPLYTKNIKSGFMPSIAKSICNHLHSKRRSSCLLILATLPTLSNWYMWPMLYFLLSFLIALFCSCWMKLLASISDLFRYCIILFTIIVTRGLLLLCMDSRYELIC